MIPSLPLGLARETLYSVEVVTIEVHRTLGGARLLESLYEDALFYELRLRNIPALSQVPIPVTYKNYKLHDPMRLDILVGDKVIIEVKVTKTVSAVYKAQVLTCLRLTKYFKSSGLLVKAFLQ